MNTFNLQSFSDTVRDLATKAKAKQVASTREANKALEIDNRLPTNVVANYAKAQFVAEASKPAVEALAAGGLVIKAWGKVLKNGDVNARIGYATTKEAFEDAVVKAQLSTMNARAKRKAAREAKQAAYAASQTPEVIAAAKVKADRISALKAEAAALEKAA